jgi:hypothetical protein
VLADSRPEAGGAHGRSPGAAARDHRGRSSDEFMGSLWRRMTMAPQAHAELKGEFLLWELVGRTYRNANQPTVVGTRIRI